MSKVEIALGHIESLFPPDSEFADTKIIGKDLMDNTIGYSIGYSNWRNLPEEDLVKLAIANLQEAGETELISELL